LCKFFYKDYPTRTLFDEYNVMELEYCNYSAQDFIYDISELPIVEMKKCLDIFFFQIIYTLVSIQNIFPHFAHRDLFMRNILGLKEKDTGKSYLYNYNNRIYCVPQKKFYPKIGDFGMSNLNEKYKDVKLFISEYKDMYNILVDVYYGDYFGSVGLK
jgi:hypothetical protein